MSHEYNQSQCMTTHFRVHSNAMEMVANRAKVYVYSSMYMYMLLLLLLSNNATLQTSAQAFQDVFSDFDAWLRETERKIQRDDPLKLEVKELKQGLTYLQVRLIPQFLIMSIVKSLWNNFDSHRPFLELLKMCNSSSLTVGNIGRHYGS